MTLLPSDLRMTISSSFTAGLISSRYSLRNWRIAGMTSSQSVSVVLVSVTKLLAMNTLFIKGKPKSSIASGEGLADSTSGKSMILPGYNNLLATNFIVSGLGVISVYMLITGLPVLIIMLFLLLFTNLLYKQRKGARE